MNFEASGWEVHPFRPVYIKRWWVKVSGFMGMDRYYSATAEVSFLSANRTKNSEVLKSLVSAVEKSTNMSLRDIITRDTTRPWYRFLAARQDITRRLKRIPRWLRDRVT